MRAMHACVALTTAWSGIEYILKYRKVVRFVRKR